MWNVRIDTGPARFAVIFAACKTLFSLEYKERRCIRRKGEKMRKTMLISFLALSCGAVALATDVVNQDNKAYKLKVQSEGKLSISNYEIRANGTMYGLCGASFCSFEIPGSKIEAKKDDRITIRGGKFVK